MTANDNCLVIEALYGISDADFRKWNTKIDINGKDCGKVMLGFDVCVSA